MGKSYYLGENGQGNLCLYPCFGGFGWERTADIICRQEELEVLILVLVDLGGKVFSHRPRDGDLKSRS